MTNARWPTQRADGARRRPIDVVVQPLAHRRKRLFLADMDSTMIGQECIDELADYAGLKAQVAAITERAMRGEIAFEPALRERVALLKGLPQTVVDEVIERAHQLTPGGTHAGRHHARERRLHLPGLRRLHAVHRTSRAMIGFDEDRANILLVDGEHSSSGQVAEPILGSEAKLARCASCRSGSGSRRRRRWRSATAPTTSR